MTDAGNGKVFLTSHRWANLQDAEGHVGLSWNRQGWEKWTITPAGNGKVFLTSHRGEQLTNNHNSPSLSAAKDAPQRWTLTDMSGAPACQFF